VPKRLCRDGVTAWFTDQKDYRWHQRNVRDRQVFAQLKLDRDNVAELVALTDQRPTEGIYLQGRVDTVYDNEIRVRYGVEALYTQQGGAEAFEKKARGEMTGVAVNAEVLVGSRGVGVLRGYSWEPLGITIAVERGPAEAADRGRIRSVVGLTVELKNHGPTPLLIADRPGARSFRLLTGDRGVLSDFRWVHDGDPVPPAGPNDFVVLQPGESRTTVIDLTSPDWFVANPKSGKGPKLPTSMTKLGEWSNAWFRFEYVPPTEAECAAAAKPGLPWRRPVRSRGFSPNAERFD
jgi:hypothetical protein